MRSAVDRPQRTLQEAASFAQLIYPRGEEPSCSSRGLVGSRYSSGLNGLPSSRGLRDQPLNMSGSTPQRIDDKSPALLLTYYLATAQMIYIAPLYIFRYRPYALLLLLHVAPERPMLSRMSIDRPPEESPVLLA